MSTKILYKYLLATMVAVLVGSCSKEDESTWNFYDPDNPTQPTQTQDESPSAICLDWNLTSAQVHSAMKGYDKVYDSDDYVCYKSKKGEYKVVYDFVDNALRSVAVIVPESAKESTTSIYSLAGYEYVGEVDGSSIYTSSSKGVMAMLMSREIDGIKYETVGFTPVESTLYQTVEPVSVEMLDVADITTNSFTANWKIKGDGIESVEQSRVIISTSSDLSSPKTYSGTSAGSNQYKYKFTKLTINTTYYLQAYVVIDGIRYDSEVVRVDLEHVDTYNIGDFYPNSASPQGVVCAITDSGQHGTIISLDEDYLKWDVNGIFCTDYSSYNSSDGSKNNMGSTQPFAKWVYNHGTGWYGPARYELDITVSDLRAINAALESKGYKRLNGFYWSSTQKNGNQSYVVTVAADGYMGYRNGYSFVHQKDNTNYVRAMKKF